MDLLSPIIWRILHSVMMGIVRKEVNLELNYSFAIIVTIINYFIINFIMILMLSQVYLKHHMG